MRDLDELIDRAINRSLATFAGRIVWALLSVGVIYACAFFFASLIIGGI